MIFICKNLVLKEIIKYNEMTSIVTLKLVEEGWYYNTLTEKKETINFDSNTIILTNLM